MPQNLTKLLLLLLSIIYICSFCFAHAEKGKGEEYCECGKYPRKKENSIKIGQNVYDTVITLGSGSDSNIDHAYSTSLGRCVAIKHCSEQIWLNKCSREMEVLMALNGTRNDHILHIYDHQIQKGQKCSESSMFSDYLRMIVVGSDKRKRRRRQNWDLEKELDNCTILTTAIELGAETAGNRWRRLNANKIDGTADLEKIHNQVKEELEMLHQLGIAHRDVHPDNVLLFPSNPQIKNNSKMNNNEENANDFLAKLIDFGWTCCFDKAKCGPRLSQILPSCEAAEGLTDDRFGLQDLSKELQKL